MAEQQFLYMMLLGCKPTGRLTEQHDIHFSIGKNLEAAAKTANASWPEAKGKIHIDAFRKINKVQDFQITIQNNTSGANENLDLFFINLGGYKENELEERHYKTLVVASNMDEAKKIVHKEGFFKTHLQPHVDDKFAIDIDDIYSVSDILKESTPGLSLCITAANENATEDPVLNGYFQLHLLEPQW